MYANATNGAPQFGTLPIAQGGTGATTAAAAASAITNGQALTPASVTATGTIKGATISDSVGTLAQLRESVSKKVRITGDLLTDGRLQLYKSGDATLVQIYWTVSSTESYFLQLTSTGNAGFYKTENGVTTNIKAW